MIVAGGQAALQPRHHPALALWRAVLPAGDQADSGPHQDAAERVEQPAEMVQGRRPGHDEDRPQQQRQPDTEQQHPC